MYSSYTSFRTNHCANWSFPISALAMSSKRRKPSGSLSLEFFHLVLKAQTDVSVLSIHH